MTKLTSWNPRVAKAKYIFTVKDIYGEDSYERIGIETRAKAALADWNLIGFRPAREEDIFLNPDGFIRSHAKTELPVLILESKKLTT